MKYVVMERHNAWIGPVAVCDTVDDATAECGRLIAQYSLDTTFGSQRPAVYFVPISQTEEA